MQNIANIKKQLKQLQFNQILIDAAIKYLKTQNIDQLIDWIGQQYGQEQKWKKWLEQQKQKLSITKLVKKQFVDQLIKKGYSKNVSEKSLLLSGNKSIEQAQNWIKQHKGDADFEQQLFLQGQGTQGSTLTDEEAKQKAKELSQKVREARLKRQQQQAKQRQKNRVRYGKQMIEAKRIAEQQTMKRQIQLDKIQKKKDEDYKKQLLQDMKRQKQAKFGKKCQGNIQSKNVKIQKKLTKLEQVQIQCQQVDAALYAYPDRSKVFFQTLGKYLSNIIQKNGDQKTRKINKQNKLFKERILECVGGLQLLEQIGFKQEEGFFMMKQWSIGELNKIGEIIKKFENRH